MSNSIICHFGMKSTIFHEMKKYIITEIMKILIGSIKIWMFDIVNVYYPTKKKLGE